MTTRTIDSLLELLHATRTRLLADLAAIDDARFEARPAEGVWSPALVVEHLAKVEAAVTRGARAMLDGRIPPVPAGPGHPPERALDRSERLVTSGTTLPEGGRTRAALMDDLARTRGEFVALLESARARDRSNLRMAHPFFGVLLMDDMFAFVAHHEERHRQQIAEIVGASS